MDSPSRLDEFLSGNKFPLAMGLVGLVLLVSGVLASGLIPKTFLKNPKPTPYPKESVVSSLPSLAVDVSGAVNNPGVYKLEPGARVEEAILAAGGISGEADPAFLSKNLNLAQKLSDGMKIYIPKAGEAASSGAVSGVSTSIPNASGPVNLNTAVLSELDKLPGVGPVTAQKIIDGRPYAGVEELLSRKVVGKSVYDKIKEMVGI